MFRRRVRRFTSYTLQIETLTTTFCREHTYDLHKVTACHWLTAILCCPVCSFPTGILFRASKGFGTYDVYISQCYMPLALYRVGGKVIFQSVSNKVDWCFLLLELHSCTVSPIKKSNSIISPQPSPFQPVDSMPCKSCNDLENDQDDEGNVSAIRLNPLVLQVSHALYHDSLAVPNVISANKRRCIFENMKRQIRLKNPSWTSLLTESRSRSRAKLSYCRRLLNLWT